MFGGTVVSILRSIGTLRHCRYRVLFHHTEASSPYQELLSEICGPVPGPPWLPPKSVLQYTWLNSIQFRTPHPFHSSMTLGRTTLAHESVSVMSVKVVVVAQKFTRSDIPQRRNRVAHVATHIDG